MLIKELSLIKLVNLNEYYSKSLINQILKLNEYYFVCEFKKQSLEQNEFQTLTFGIKILQISLKSYLKQV